MTATAPDHALKLLLVGDSSVGKSSILLRFTDDTFSDKQAATIGVDFKCAAVAAWFCTLIVAFRSADMNWRGKLIRAQVTVWDTAGQEKFRSLTSAYYRGTHGIVVVYDVSSRDSFSHLEAWLNEIATYTSSDECVMLLVGNKIDLEAREVTREEGLAFARDRGMVFIETSAKTREGIKHTFEELVQKVLDNPRLEAETRPKDKSNIVAPKVQPSGDAGGGGGDGGACGC